MEANQLQRLISHKDLFKIATPIMIANVSTPLIGVVDTIIIGQVPDPTLIGSVAIASLIFTFIFWSFGFLRMGTTGLTAQALGANDHEEIRAILGRSILLAFIIGLTLITLQKPISNLSFFLLQGSTQVEFLAHEYFDIRIWSAPATLTNYVLLGWLIAIGKAKHALGLQLLLNISNILFDTFFVLGLNMGIQGVALGTIVAEYSAALVGIGVVLRVQSHLLGSWDIRRILKKARVIKTLSVNIDILVRTFALLIVFSWFTATSATLGDTALAANAVLLHFLTMSAYFLDGIALATEKFVGESIGSRSRTNFVSVAKLSTSWAVGVAAVLSCLLMIFGPTIIDFITVTPAVREVAKDYVHWAALAPLIGVWCFQLDGIFIGATATSAMRNSMLVSTFLFFITWIFLERFGNLGLWIALLSHFVYRAITLYLRLPNVIRSIGL